MKITTMDNGARTDKPQGAGTARGEETRLKILKAARHIFVRYPFQSASLRMIGDAAGVRHPLIIHYFGSKTVLFEEIAQALEIEFLSIFPQIARETERCQPEEGLKQLISLLLGHGFQYPDPFKAIMLNVGETDNLEIALPGLGRMAEVRRKFMGLLNQGVFRDSFQKETDMFVLVLILSIANFVGSEEFHAKALGLPHGSLEYKQWVGEMFDFLFMPAMEVIADGSLPPVSSLTEAFSKNEVVLEQLFSWKVEAVQRAPSKIENKGQATRGKILKAARQVFSRYPYSTASIRMIGKLGKFDFTLIHHYFPTKADLFESVAKDVFEEFVQAACMWGFGLEDRPFPQILAIYLDRTLTYCLKQREALGILMHNIAYAEQLVDLEGFSYITRFHSQIYDLVRGLLPMDAPDPKLRMWLYTLITVLYSFVGAPEYPSRLLSMNPDSESYHQWVLEALFSVFLPVFLKNTSSH